VPHSRSPRRRRCDRRAASGGHTVTICRSTPPLPQKARLAGPEIVLPYSVAAACPKLCGARRCLKNPVQGSFLRVRLRADSHIPTTQFCAARNPLPINSDCRSGARAARQVGATPPKFSAAPPHCGRAPTHAKEPLGAPPPLDHTLQCGSSNKADRRTGGGPGAGGGL